MPRKTKENYSTCNFGLSFSFKCFVSYRNVIESSKSKYFWRWLFVIIILVIYLQYEYNISYQFERNVKKNESNSNENRYKAALPRYSNDTPMCFLNKSLLRPIKVDRSYISPRDVERLRLRVKLGGYYAPRHCRPRHKVAILVPFRNRTTNLSKFLRHMHPFLQNQFLEYRIFVIEQIGSGKFNKGALYNIGYLEMQRFGKWDCMVFHDVDLLPKDERVLYTCPRKPTHMCPTLDCWGNKFYYKEIFGGVTSMPTRTYLKINGYSNEYWNWGAEDDDMYIRIKSCKITIWRYNSSIARFTCLPHPKCTENPDRHKLLRSASKRYRTDGLNSLEYKLIAIIERKLFTHILANVNPFKYTV